MLYSACLMVFVHLCRLIAQGFAAVVVKPYTETVLKEAVLSVVRHSRTSRPSLAHGQGGSNQFSSFARQTTNASTVSYT